MIYQGSKEGDKYESNALSGILLQTTYMNIRVLSSTITQFISWPFVYFFATLFFKVRIIHPEKLRSLHSPFIIISNHISPYDSFMFRLVLGVFPRQLPLRFMAVKVFEYPFLNFLAWIGFIDLVYILFGVFVVKKGQGIKRNLVHPRRIIEHGGNIVMYPEGRMTEQSHQVGEFKLGAAVLARDTGVPVIPCAMKIVDTGTFRRTFSIAIGDPLVAHEHEDVKEITLKFHQTIRNLFLSI